jgi:hypothetical protein
LERAPGEQNQRMLILQSLMTLTAVFVVAAIAMALMISGAPERRKPARVVVRTDEPTARRPRS